MKMNETNIVRKISMKVLGVQAAAKKTRTTEKPIALARIWGVARGVKGVTTDLGVANALIGSFEAISLLDKKEYASPKLFLPAGADDLIIASMGQDTTGVQFAYEFGAEPDSSQIGYRYTVRNLIKPAENDVLAQIRAQVNPLQLTDGKTNAPVAAPAEPAQKQESQPAQKQESHPASKPSSGMGLKKK